MKPYQRVPIQDCQEKLVAVPLEQFAVESPHPYVKLGAPYGNRSPYYLRAEVLNRLLQAQQILQQSHPGWRIQIFDAYRPIAVQQFMVNYAFQQALEAEGLTATNLTVHQQQRISAQVDQFWAAPSLDPATPPPHSTGAAVDVTLVDAAGQVVDMGSDIDEMSPRSQPNYYGQWVDQRMVNPAVLEAAVLNTATHSEILEASADGSESAFNSDAARLKRAKFHQNRQILTSAMLSAGFQQHPQEWWHFSYGDQLWAWLTQQKTSPSSSSPLSEITARYGAI